MDVPPGSVIVTPTDLFTEVRATHHAVTEMRGEIREIARVVPDHESRIRTLEKKVWWASGTAAGAAAAISQLIQALGKA